MTDHTHDHRGAGDGFDWADLADDDIVAPPQAEIAVYLNPAHDLVIRQRADLLLERDDAVIVIGRAHVSALIERVVELYRTAPEAAPLDVAAALALPPPAPAQTTTPQRRDRTTAARSRRYRQRRHADRHASRRDASRQSTVTATVTQRDAPTDRRHHQRDPEADAMTKGNPGPLRAVRGQKGVSIMINASTNSATVTTRQARHQPPSGTNMRARHAEIGRRCPGHAEIARRYAWADASAARVAMWQRPTRSAA